MKKSSEAIECGHCGEINRMRVIGAVTDTEGYDIDAPNEAGILYEVYACSNCKQPMLVGGFWHDGMDDPSEWKPNLWLPDGTNRIARLEHKERIADREFMKLAIMEARKSKSEAGIKPKVGAVVSRAGALLAFGHRGELAAGDHAEFTVLEGKCKDEMLAGATVYTTLEPCTTRTDPKIPCVNRLVGRKVARVVIGMLDPNETIRGRGVLALRKANIQVDLFPPDLMNQLEELNREFIAEHE